MLIVVMGASGAGKTTVGSALAGELGWHFVDADALHADVNVAKIRSGQALTDEDRAPWLAKVHAAITNLSRDHTNAVLACSALRERYRATIAEGIADIRWVFLAADAALLEARLRERRGHFAGPAIVRSQLDTLEPPRDALTFDADLPVDVLVTNISTQLGLR